MLRNDGQSQRRSKRNHALLKDVESLDWCSCALRMWLTDKFIISILKWHHSIQCQWCQMTLQPWKRWSIIDRHTQAYYYFLFLSWLTTVTIWQNQNWCFILNQNTLMYKQFNNMNPHTQRAIVMSHATKSALSCHDTVFPSLCEERNPESAAAGTASMCHSRGHVKSHSQLLANEFTPK